jgi:hypothetical protein
VYRNRVASAIIRGSSGRPFRRTSNETRRVGGKNGRKKVGGDEVVGAVINVGAIGTLCAARRPWTWQ